MLEFEKERREKEPSALSQEFVTQVLNSYITEGGYTTYRDVKMLLKGFIGGKGQYISELDVVKAIDSELKQWDVENDNDRSPIGKNYVRPALLIQGALLFVGSGRSNEEAKEVITKLKDSPRLHSIALQVIPHAQRADFFSEAPDTF